MPTLERPLREILSRIFGIIQMTNKLGRARHSGRAAAWQPTLSASRGLPALPILLICLSSGCSEEFSTFLKDSGFSRVKGPAMKQLKFKKQQPI
jgi:hypothetical protein